MRRSDSFWSWYVRSARRDGTSVSSIRRCFGFLAGILALVAWYIWVANTQPTQGRIIHKLVTEHPVFMVVAAVSAGMMGFRQTVVDYMAFRLYASHAILIRRGIFGNELKVFRTYEATFGRDSLYRMPELMGVGSVLIFAVAAFTMVFSHR